MSPRAGRSNAGFTLVEVLWGLALFSALAMTTTVAFGSAAKIFQERSGRAGIEERLEMASRVLEERVGTASCLLSPAPDAASSTLLAAVNTDCAGAAFGPVEYLGACLSGPSLYYFHGAGPAPATNACPPAGSSFGRLSDESVAASGSFTRQGLPHNAARADLVFKPASDPGAQPYQVAWTSLLTVGAPLAAP